MQTTAVFEDIAERIKLEIDRAEDSIFIAVAWFTNKDLFNCLISKAKKGCNVSLLISNDEINTKINFEKLAPSNFRIYKVGDGDTQLMHNKFCIIDRRTVISGSFNWSYKASKNSENIVITEGDDSLADQFIKEFNSLLKRYNVYTTEEQNDLPVNLKIKHFEIIKNLILIEEEEGLSLIISRLEKFQMDGDVKKILHLIHSREYLRVVKFIDDFKTKSFSLEQWMDPEIPILKLETRDIENKINAFENEKSEIEKAISDFQNRHSKELGKIILEILKYRKKKFRHDPTKAKEAEEDFRNYNKQYKIEEGKIKFELTAEELKELKSDFRKASFLCHPDKVKDEDHAAAQDVFNNLKHAYESNDLSGIRNILTQLQKGIFTPAFSHSSEIDFLRRRLEQLKFKMRQLEKEIDVIKSNETYITVTEISDWDGYFTKTKNILLQELEDLKNEKRTFASTNIKQ